MIVEATAAELDRLERILELERELARRRAADPLSCMRWLPGQRAFLRSRAKRKLFRAGNQAQGKTTAGAVECIWRALGTHPFKDVPPPPTFQWAIGSTHEHSGIVQSKLWELVPRELVADDCEYDDRKGSFLGKYPKLRFKNGSSIAFKTGGGDTTNLASAKVHHVWFDEPPESERVYNEAQKRLLRTNGDMSITMTPVNRPVDWLKEKAAVDAKAGQVEDLHFPLVPENLLFDDGTVMTLDDGTPMDAAWIAQIVAETSDMEVPVVVHGGWEFRLEGAYFEKVWNPGRMVHAAPVAELYAEHLGIDFGDQPGKQIVLYILVDPKGGRGGYPHVHVDDEYIGTTGRETNEDDARGVLRMLRTRRTKYSKLDGVMADRQHKAGRADQKSAGDLQRAIGELLGIGFHDVNPPVLVAKRGAGRGSGSVRTRSRWLHGQMSRGNFTVHPRCKRLIEALGKYSPWNDDEWKDPLDALLYGLDKYIYAAERGARGSRVESW